MILFKFSGVYTGAYASDYRNGTGRINFYDVDCNGNEMNLTSCSYSTSLHRYCSHYRDAGVTCRGYTIITLIIITLQSCNYFVLERNVWGLS